jgi:hypothetical protein
MKVSYAPASKLSVVDELCAIESASELANSFTSTSELSMIRNRGILKVTLSIGQAHYNPVYYILAETVTLSGGLSECFDSGLFALRRLFASSKAACTWGCFRSFSWNARQPRDRI